MTLPDRFWMRFELHSLTCDNCGTEVLVKANQAEWVDTDKFCVEGRKLFWFAARAEALGAA